MNNSKIDKRRYELTLRLPLDTTVEEIKGLMESIKLVLYSNTEVIANTLQVNVSEITEDSVNIFIYLYINTADYAEFLKFKTKANLSVMKLLEDKGIKLAYPGQNVYVNNVEKI